MLASPRIVSSRGGEMVNAADLKSAAAKAACGFKPRPRHWELFGISPARERLGQGVDDRPGPIRVLQGVTLAPLVPLGSALSVEDFARFT